jgi:hypothetical protein
LIYDFRRRRAAFISLHIDIVYETAIRQMPMIATLDISSYIRGCRADDIEALARILPPLCRLFAMMADDLFAAAAMLMMLFSFERQIRHYIDGLRRDCMITPLFHRRR